MNPEPVTVWSLGETMRPIWHLWHWWRPRGSAPPPNDPSDHSLFPQTALCAFKGAICTNFSRKPKKRFTGTIATALTLQNLSWSDSSMTKSKLTIIWDMFIHQVLQQYCMFCIILSDAPVSFNYIQMCLNWFPSNLSITLPLSCRNRIKKRMQSAARSAGLVAVCEPDTENRLLSLGLSNSALDWQATCLRQGNGQKRASLRAT